MKNTLLLLLIAIIALPACRQCEKTNHYYNRTATKLYLPHYKDGSYFIYQNATDSADVDTFYVKSSSDSMDLRYTESKCDGSYYETVKFSLVSAVHHDSLVCMVLSGPNEDNVYFGGTYDKFVFADNFETFNDNRIIVSGGQGDTAMILPNYKVLNNIYDNVLETSAQQLYQKPNNPVVFYFAANIGIIQFNTFDRENNVIGSIYLLKGYELL